MAQAQVSQLPRSLMETSVPAQLLVLRPTSLTAKHTRHAADAALTAVQVRPAQPVELNPTVALRCGGVFVAMCPDAMRAGANLEGTRNVQ
jgi:hypothetical protein